MINRIGKLKRVPLERDCYKSDDDWHQGNEPEIGQFAIYERWDGYKTRVVVTGRETQEWVKGLGWANLYHCRTLESRFKAYLEKSNG
jgi:hypothetical protein